MSLALLFPGQGSQHVGMGRALAEREPVAAEVLARADEVLGLPLTTLMWSGPEEDLTETRNAQPAILAHSVAALRVARCRLGQDVTFAAGHSLGEFSAYVAAGTISFEDALSCVRLRGELMHHAGTERRGTMAAVLGLSEGEVEEVCARVDAGVCVPANFNSAGQVVVSGDVAGVEQGLELARQAGARVKPLTVSGAFHSPLMEPAAEGLRERLASVPLKDPGFPVVSNATAEPVTTAARARELLVLQLTSPVRWSASIGVMSAAGVDRFLELGPGSVLCGLNRRNAKEARCSSVGAPEDLEGLDE